MFSDGVGDDLSCPPAPSRADEQGESLNALWQQAVAGDVEAFAFFYLRHKDTVVNHCMMRVRDRHDAEDLTAEVFMLAWQQRAKVFFHEESDVLPWLLRTSDHLVRHHLRSTALRQRFLRRLPRATPVPDLAEQFVESDEKQRMTRFALAALAALRPVDRRIIELIVIDELSPSAAAVAMGVPAGTVRSRLSRARSRARRHYDALAADQSGHQDQEST